MEDIFLQIGRTEIYMIQVDTAGFNSSDGFG